MSGLWMAQFYPWPAGDGVGVYVERLVFGSAMLLSIALSLDAVRRRDFKSHGAWMTRAYAIGMGAGTQVLTHLPWFILVGKPGETARTVLMGAAWVINVVAAEWVIRKQASAVAFDRSVTRNAAPLRGRPAQRAPLESSTPMCRPSPS
jgi:hypothetical protein